MEEVVGARVDPVQAVFLFREEVEMVDLHRRVLVAPWGVALLVFPDPE